MTREAEKERLKVRLFRRAACLYVHHGDHIGHHSPSPSPQIQPRPLFISMPQVSTKILFYFFSLD